MNEMYDSSRDLFKQFLTDVNSEFVDKKYRDGLGNYIMVMKKDIISVIASKYVEYEVKLSWGLPIEITAKIITTVLSDTKELTQTDNIIASRLFVKLNEKQLKKFEQFLNKQWQCYYC